MLVSCVSAPDLDPIIHKQVMGIYLSGTKKTGPEISMDR
jgi:hypothetical protein